MAPRNLGPILARIARIPVAVKRAVETQLDKEADDLVAAMKVNAPVNAREARPGQLRDSIHKEAGRRELQRRIVADAKDDEGHVYAAHVEHGHRSAGGSHVAGVPFFFPTYRSRKAGMKRRLNKAAKDAIRPLTVG